MRQVISLDICKSRSWGNTENESEWNLMYSSQSPWSVLQCLFIALSDRPVLRVEPDKMMLEHGMNTF
jgi:hypothetical protein